MFCIDIRKYEYCSSDLAFSVSKLSHAYIQYFKTTPEAVNVPSRQVAWGGAGATSGTFAASSPIWDGPSLESGNKPKANRFDFSIFSFYL